jgi:hypothetical protein
MPDDLKKILALLGSEMPRDIIQGIRANYHTEGLYGAAADSILKLLTHSSAMVRCEVIWFCREIGRKAFAPLLRAMREDPDSDVRIEAAPGADLRHLQGFLAEASRIGSA